jgi:hypothetical protein
VDVERRAEERILDPTRTRITIPLSSSPYPSAIFRLLKEEGCFENIIRCNKGYVLIK